jgi:hypothetical protein
VLSSRNISAAYDAIRQIAATDQECEFLKTTNNDPTIRSIFDQGKADSMRSIAMKMAGDASFNELWNQLYADQSGPVRVAA